jgi:hypothetical protein
MGERSPCKKSSSAVSCSRTQWRVPPEQRRRIARAETEEPRRSREAPGTAPAVVLRNRPSPCILPAQRRPKALGRRPGHLPRRDKPFYQSVGAPGRLLRASPLRSLSGAAPGGAGRLVPAGGRGPVSRRVRLSNRLLTIFREQHRRERIREVCRSGAIPHKEAPGSPTDRAR